MSRTTLTDADLLVIKAHVLADPVLAPLTSGPGTDFAAIAAALNTQTGTKAWRTNVPPQDSDDAPNMAQFDGLTAGKRDGWALFLAYPRDFSRNKVRQWIVDMWGNATAASNAEAILLAGTENARRVETVIGGSTKSTGTVSALDRTFEGMISIEQVNRTFTQL